LSPAIIAAPSSVAPGWATTTATTPSPKSGCGTPITADSATPAQVLAGKRRLNVRQISTLCRRFGVAADVLLQASSALSLRRTCAHKPAVWGVSVSMGVTTTLATPRPTRR
jgi:hypothetical protein